MGLTACDDFLDSEPKSSVDPDKYFTEASQLQAYADEIYPRILPGSNYGYYGTDDQYTDNQIPETAPDRFFEGQWKVPYSEGNWSFETIYRLNFFFSEVLPRFGEDLSGSQNTISGDLVSIKHYIGEMYTLRALEYFKRYQNFGDFPIITEPLPDDETALIEASKRMPRNEVARFILSDLDKAAVLMNGKDMVTTRINRDLALLIKSRVALYEGTWLKYFKGTAFVPNGEGWPGKSKEYNANYQYPSGSIENEINYFLDEAISASKEVAEKYKNSLTANTGTLQQNSGDSENPFYEMYAVEDLSSYPEVLLWKQYTYGVSTHGICVGANQGNWALGITRACVQNFLMADGTPVYKNGSYSDGNGVYKGDKTIADVRANRDSRLSVFLKEPGQKNILVDGTSPLSTFYRTEPYPGITDGANQTRATTGYLLRKGGAFDVKHYQDVWAGFVGVVLYRSAEALLNYMEASYEKNGTLDGTAREYWQILRRRAHVSEDIDATIMATDMAKEAENEEQQPLSPDEQKYVEEYLRSLGDMNEETPEEVRMAYYLPKVVEEAVRLHHPEVFIGDMIQEGNIVLMLALKEIRKEKDEEEILEQVRAGMLASLESQTEVKRRDHKMVEKVTELDETIKSMKEEYGRKVSVDEVADRLGISEDEIEDILKLAGEEVKDEE